MLLRVLVMSDMDCQVIPKRKALLQGNKDNGLLPPVCEGETGSLLSSELCINNRGKQRSVREEVKKVVLGTRGTDKRE